jgi:hypothetical protein
VYQRYTKQFLPALRAIFSPNGRPPTTLPEPMKRARDQDFRGFAGEGNVAERSERMRAQRSPTSSDLYPGSKWFSSEERGWALLGDF